MRRLSTTHPFRCVTCELEIVGSPTFHLGLPFCCAGCAADGPCICSYDQEWPLTAAVWEQLDAELVRLKAEVARLASSGSGEANDADLHLMHLPLAQAGKRLQRLRAVAADATVTDDHGRAVIGRRVTLRETDGGVVDYVLVLPGDGEPSQGLISADSPLGSAILNCRPGETAETDAPTGRHLVTVESVG